MALDLPVWENKPSTASPMNKSNLDKYNAALNALDVRTGELEDAGAGYTDEQARDAISAALVAGTNVSIVVSDVGDTITISATGGGGGESYTDEQVRDVIGAALRAGTGVTVTASDASNTITIAATGSGAPAAVALTDGATVAVNASLGKVFKLAAAGNRVILKPTGSPVDGQALIIRHTAVTSARTLDLADDGFAFDLGIESLTATAAGTTDYIGTIFDSTDGLFHVLTVAKGSDTDGEDPGDPGGGDGPSDAVIQEIAFEITSTAENSRKDWYDATVYRYIQDIFDGRGYTAGIVGFTSATGDMLDLIQRYAIAKPSGNTLSGYIDNLEECVAVGDTTEDADYESEGGEASDIANSELGSAFRTAWANAANSDSIFRQAQRDYRETEYWDPAFAQAEDDEVGPLGRVILYDISINHGPGSDSESFGGIVATAQADADPPSEGGDETDYLNALIDAREAILADWGDDQADGRVHAHRQLVNGGTQDDSGDTISPNLTLELPIKWSMYGEDFEITSYPTPVT